MVTDIQTSTNTPSISNSRFRIGGEFDGAIVSSVVPPLMDIMKAAVRHRQGITVVVGAGVKTGMNI